MPNDFDERFERYEDMTKRLIAMMVNQDRINERLTASIEELREFNRQQLVINADIRTTLARIETLIARLPRGGENGREA